MGEAQIKLRKNEMWVHNGEGGREGVELRRANSQAVGESG